MKYAELLALVVIAACAWGLYHLGYSQGTSDAAISLNQEQDANNASQGAIAGLRMSLAQCETNQLVDQVAATKALQERDSDVAAAGAAYKAALENLDQLKQGECRAWMAAPACGSFP